MVKFDTTMYQLKHHLGGKMIQCSFISLQ